MLSCLMIGTLVAIAYASCSFLLLKRPMLLYSNSRQKRKLAFSCKHISHRGGAGEHLENTLTAFEHAVKCGTEMLELDCQLTSDDQVVVCHDNHLRRIADVDAFISDTPYHALPDIKPLLVLDFDQDFEVLGSVSDRRIPLLKDVFRMFPDIVINIDIKTQSKRLIKEVNKLVKEYDRELITVWGNYRDSVCRKCYEANPNIPMLFSMKQVFRLLCLFYSGLLPFVQLKESCLEIPMSDVLMMNSIPSKHRLMLKAIDKLLMRKSLFLHLRKRGIEVYLWVLNREEDWDRAFSLGASGVMTDFPTRLQEYLAAHPEYPIPV